MDIKNLEARLNDFDPSVRKAALLEAEAAFENGTIEAAAVTSAHNMHCHSFFSYNGYGYSPSYVVYLAKKMGFYAVGLVDFDVLDGVDEFIEALNLLGVRGCCGIISTDDSTVKVLRIPTNEELPIARDTLEIVSNL